MSGHQLNWGVLGCGHIVHDFTLSLGKAEHNHQVIQVESTLLILKFWVVAVGASDVERSQKFITERGYDAKAYGSYLEVLNDSNVEVVYIGLRNAEHFEYVMKALDHGKHVLCEKPLGINAKQVESMVNKARAKNLFLMQGFWSLFFPAYRRIAEIIKSKELGAPRLVNATFGYSLPESFVNLDRGETMLTCLGCYTIMFAQFVFGGKPEDFSYTGGRNSKNADSWTNLHLKFGENKDAILLFDERHFLPNDGFIGFEKGTIKVHGNFWCPTEITLITNEGKDHKTETFPLNDDRSFIYPNSSGLRYEADHVYKKIKIDHATQSDIMPLDDILALQETVDSIRKKMKISFPQDKMFIYDLMRLMSLTK
ncbi:Trans-1,2-dihydrobenzene-1,2-diol dehydrogenase-like protein [Aphelenchoides bicaudatus]|nr:Trans-1,2-dihydrobenzene-1,2-diol dehydrogenase-like protein [Aphelenchoides bicaudatus]